MYHSGDPPWIGEDVTESSGTRLKVDGASNAYAHSEGLHA